jgi:elongation factor 1-gamma
MTNLKLHTDAGNFRAFKILIAAEYAGVNIDIPEFKMGHDNTTAEFRKMSPLGKVPVLETAHGSIFESNAIARYVARLRADAHLMGYSFFESGQVDSWVDFSAHELELPATLWYYPVLGSAPYNPAIAARAKADVTRALKVVECHLMERTYLVGERVTLADITVASALVYPFKFVMDGAFRAQFPNVVRWFTTLVHQPQFEAVVGTVVFADKELVPEGGAAAAAPAATKGGKPDQAPKEKKAKEEKKPKEEKPKEKKEEKPKEEKKPKKKDDDEDEPEPDFVEEKKAEHPFKILDKTHPTDFVMDTWKKTYSNCTDYYEAMQYFHEKFDAAGWSLWRGDYKYNDECKVLFMTSNLIAGFIQRTEEIRKWLFGTLTIRGVEGKRKI